MIIQNVALFVDPPEEPRVGAKFFALRLGHTMGMDLIEATDPDMHRLAVTGTQSWSCVLIVPHKPFGQPLVSHVRTEAQSDSEVSIVGGRKRFIEASDFSIQAAPYDKIRADQTRVSC